MSNMGRKNLCLGLRAQARESQCLDTQPHVLLTSQETLGMSAHGIIFLLPKTEPPRGTCSLTCS